MSYEGWEYGYVAGALGALAYCVVNPVRGRMIGLAIAGIASRPGNLSGAGDKWGEIAKALEGVGADLKKHVSDVPPKDWTAQDEEAFKGAVDIMLKNIDDGAGVHFDSAKIMHGMSKLSFYGGMASGAVGALLTALTIYTIATRGIPVVNVASQATSEIAATGAQVTVGGLVKKYGMAAGAAAMVFTMVQSKQAELESKVTAMSAQQEQAKQTRIPLSNI
ncbi:hypothetical protein AB0O34_20825 [Sphaerisporangium sp. NPDC088356]|uniref:hypothetical protein n=1 Tax=Sphaerisporangium sp. NPDC088356 TaxID=3154871 RepID=UPI00343AFEFA